MPKSAQNGNSPAIPAGLCGLHAGHWISWSIQSYFRIMVRGANELPIHHLLKLCEYYDVTADYILGLDQEDGPER